MAKRVLILCTGNSCRSQMAEALWRDLGEKEWESFSAGSSPAGYVHSLVARFPQSAAYYLVYGNSEVGQPNYDLDRFTSRIPETLARLELGDEQEIEKMDQGLTQPMFQNKVWLWAIMTVIILSLGWFTVRMMRKN